MMMGMAMTQSLISYPSSKLHVLCCQPKTPPSPEPRRTDGSKSRRLLQRKDKETKKQPSVAEIERAIGAGIFRDSDNNINRDSEDGGNTLFESIVSNSIGESEGLAERKLREVSEWVVRRSEKSSNSAGKNILKVLFLLVLPIWAVSLLVVSGAVKLPFVSTYLDDLLM